MNENRRSYKREDITSEIRIISGKMFMIGKSLNISAGGMLIMSDHRFNIGSTINVKVIDPKSINFYEINAKVERIENKEERDNFRIGIKYTDIDKEKREMLNKSFINL